MKISHIFIIIITVLFLSINTSCKLFNGDDDDNKSKKSDFNGPSEFVDNSSISDAIDESEFNLYFGNNPPSIMGTYKTFGNILHTSSSLSSYIGQSLGSTTFFIFDQTDAGRIKITEQDGDNVAYGTGGYITGDDQYFTLYQEGIQGEEAGLPEGVTLYVSFILSGRKSTFGTIEEAEFLNVTTNVVSTNPDYDYSEGEWYMGAGYMNLQ